MKVTSLQEISKMDSFALTSVLDYWKDYEPKSVLLAYAELKRRNYSIPSSLLNKQVQFSERNNGQNIEHLLGVTMKEMGFNSYDEYFYKEFPKKALTEEQIKVELEKESKLDSGVINQNNILSAGRAIKSVVSLIVVMFVFTVFAAIIANTSRDVNTIKYAYIFIALLSLICSTIILVKLYSAGDNLVKSVK